MDQVGQPEPNINALWERVFRIIGDKVDVPTTINAVATLVLAERDKAVRDHIARFGTPKCPDCGMRHAPGQNTCCRR